MVLWLKEGRWWCSSCGESGDAATFIMATEECNYAEAAAYLSRRFGPPAGQARAARRPWFWRRR